MDFRESKNFAKLASRLFEDAVEREQFAAAMAAGQSAAPAVIWVGNPPAEKPFAANTPAAWQPKFVERLKQEERAGSHPLHDDGAYYCLDLSSVFQSALLAEIGDPVRTALDVRASPGGKSIFAWRLFSPELLVCNEVTGKRVSALVSNLERCKVPANIVSSDVSILAAAWPDAFDLVLVDAPCSGQSLLSRKISAPSCFHPATLNMNSNRQKRILATSAQTVRPGGYLLYSTCTYSPEENESVVEWLLKKFPAFRPVESKILNAYRSRLSSVPCYRLYPHQQEGAGGFCALFVNGEDTEPQPIDLARVKLIRRT